MSPQVFEWLLTCPGIRGISPLALALHTDVMFDLRRGVARAVSINMRERASGRLLTSQPHGYHERTARMYSTRPSGGRLSVEHGVLRMAGRLVAGVGISEMRGRAVIHFRTTLPDTIVAAAVGRSMAELVAVPAFQRGSYTILSLSQDAGGVSVWFSTPEHAIPFANVARLGGGQERDG